MRIELTARYKYLHWYHRRNISLGVYKPSTSLSMIKSTYPDSFNHPSQKSLSCWCKCVLMIVSWLGMTALHPSVLFLSKVAGRNSCKVSGINHLDEKSESICLSLSSISIASVNKSNGFLLGYFYLNFDMNLKILSGLHISSELKSK